MLQNKMDIQSHTADDIGAFLASIPAITTLGIHVQVFRLQACVKVQVVENWNNPCYPGGNIANASSMASTSHFLAFIAFIALGASAAAFFAPFFAMLNTGELKRYLGECKCHSRLASLNQTTRQVLHHTALGKRYNVKQAWTQGCKAYHRAPQSGDRSEWSNKRICQSKMRSIAMPNYVWDPNWLKFGQGFWNNI